ncbi:MAG TPA: helix-turn-helix transcriptional regulator [Bacteroidia bacterium]|nr:helix-turn-helix transcriptional regulator [Bacteroidia bacterium]
MKIIPVRRIHTLQNEPDFSGSFSIRDVGDLCAGKSMVQELHRHDYFFILVLKKGKGIHDIDFNSYVVSDNSVFFMRPGQVHQLTLKAGSKGYLMQFKPGFYFPNHKASAQLLRKASNKILCQPDPKRFDKLLAVLNSVFQEYTDKQEGYAEVIKANLGVFFIELVRSRQKSTAPSTKVSPFTEERLEALLELLDTHISNHKQVSHYADMLHISTFQLNAITKAALGKTCSELINERIVLESKRHLLATTNQVNQIAYHLGYDDVSYFIRFFKKHTGYSPESFRKNFK